jgi:hypothetical protein
LSGSVALNEVVQDTAIAAIDNLERKDGGDNVRADSVTVTAENSTGVGSFSGAAALNETEIGGTSVAVAGALSQNTLNGVTEAYISGAVMVTGALVVDAHRTGAIVSLSAGFAVASGGEAETDVGIAIAGSVSVNVIDSTTEAYLTNARAVLAGDSRIKARDEALIISLGGAVGYARGKAGLGTAISVNVITDNTLAYVDSADIAQSGGSFEVAAQTDNPGPGDAKIVSAAASVGIAVDGLAASGMVSVNVVTDTTEAYLTSSSLENATGTGLTVHAEDSSQIVAIGGNLALSEGGSLGLGIAVSYNAITSTVQAYLDGTDVGTAAIAYAGPITIQADNTSEIDGFTVGAAAAVGNDKTVAATGSVSVNIINDTIHAFIDDHSAVHVAGSVAIESSDASKIVGDAGGFALALAANKDGNTVGVAVGMSIVINTITVDLLAAVDDSQVLGASGLSVTTSSEATIDALSLVGSAAVALGTEGAEAYSGAGALTVNTITDTTHAEVEDSQVTLGSGAVTVTASDSSSINSDTGAAALAVALNPTKSLAIALGVGVSVNVVNSGVSAVIDGSAITSMAGVTVDASSAEQIRAFSLGVAGSIGAGSKGLGISIGGAGALSINSMGVSTEAAIESNSHITVTAGALSVQAQDNSSIKALAGEGGLTIAGSSSGSGGGLGLGFSLTVNNITDTTLASIEDSGVSAEGAVDVMAESHADIESRAFGLQVSGKISGSGSAIDAQATGALSFNDIHSAVEATIGNSQPAPSGAVFKAGGGVEVDANDDSTIQAVAIAAALTLSGSTSALAVAVDIGLALAHNRIDKDIAASIVGVPEVETDGHDVIVHASDAAAITVTSVAAAASFAIGDTAVGVAGGAAESTNIILARTNAFITDSTLGSAADPVGKVDIAATSTAKIDAVIAGIAVAVAGGTGEEGLGVGAAVGIAVARNFIGYDPDGTPVSGNVIDVPRHDDTTTPPLPELVQGVTTVRIVDGALAGDIYQYIGPTQDDSDLSKDGKQPYDLRVQQYQDTSLWKQINIAEEPAQVRAFLQNSSIHAAGDLSILTNANEEIHAVVIAFAAGIGGGIENGVGLSGAGVYAENKIRTDINADIDGDGTTGISAASVEIVATDQSSIDAIAGAAALSFAFGAEVGVAVSIGLSLGFNEVDNEVQAFTVNANDGITTSAGNVTISAATQDRHLFELSNLNSSTLGSLTAADLDNAATAAQASPDDPTDPNSPNQEPNDPNNPDDDTGRVGVTQVVNGDELVFKSEHTFKTGDAVVYENHGGEDIGLVDGTTYYAIVVDSRTIKLAQTQQDAQAANAIALTDGQVTDGLEFVRHPANVFRQDAIHDQAVMVALRAAMDAQLTQQGQSPLPVQDTVATESMFTTDSGRLAVAKVVGSDELVFNSDHSFNTGDAVVYENDSGQDIGLPNASASGTYYAIVVDKRTIKLALTKDDAKAQTPIAITSLTQPAAGLTGQSVRPMFEVGQGTTVKLAKGYANGGDPERVYEYIGPATGDTDAPVNLDLAKVNYTSPEWLEVDKLRISVVQAGQSWELISPNGTTYTLERTSADGAPLTLSVGKNTINAISAAAAVAVGLGGDVGVAVSGAGAVAQNVILGSTEAYAQDSKITSAGDVSLRAESGSAISSTVLALSAAAGVAIAEGAGFGASIGVAVARNFIGWVPGADAATPLQVESYLEDTPVHALGNLSLTSLADQSINSFVLAGSVAIAGGLAFGIAASGSGVFSENRIGIEVDSDILGTGLTPVPTDAASVTLSADDTSAITAFAGAISIAAGIGIETLGAALSIGVTIATNTIDGHVEAAIDGADVDATSGAVSVTATDTASISSTAVAASLGIGGGFVGVGLSGAGALAENTIYGGTFARILHSVVASTGDVTVDAEDTSHIGSIIIAASAGVGVGVVGIGASIGVTLARNLIGGALDTDPTHFSSAYLSTDNVLTLRPGDEVRIANGPRTGDVYQYLGTTDVHATYDFTTATGADEVMPGQRVFVPNGGGGDAVYQYIGKDPLDPSYDYKSDDRPSQVSAGQRVFVPAAGATPGAVYAYVGSGPLDHPNLNAQDYTDTAKWQRVSLDLTAQNYTDTGKWQRVMYTSASTPTQIKNGDQVLIPGTGGGEDHIYQYVGKDPLANPNLTFDPTGNQGQDYTNLTKWRPVTILQQQDFANSDQWKLLNVDRRALQVEASVQDSSIHAGGALSISAQGEQTINAVEVAGSVALAGGLGAAGLSGAGAASDNSVTTDVAAFIDGDHGGGISATGISITASDLSHVDAVVLGVSVAAALGGISGALSIGVSLATNTVDNTVNAYIANAAATASTGDITVSATEDARIEATSVAVSVAVGIGVLGGVGISGAGALAQNVILGQTHANATNSELHAAGNVSFTAQDNSEIDATIDGISVAAAGGLGGLGVAIGAAVARNLIGYQQDGTVDAVEVMADTVNTGIIAGGALALSATSQQTIKAGVLALSVAVAGGIGFGLAGAGSGASAENRSAVDVKAAINGDGVAGIDAGTITLIAHDNSSIDADVAGVAVAVSFGIAALAVSVGVAIAENDIGNDVEASISNAEREVRSREGGIVLDAKEISTISTSSAAVAVATAIGLGAGAAGSGASSTNDIHDSVGALILNSADVESAGQVSVTADDTATVSAAITSVAVAGGLIGVAIGATVAQNAINDPVSASIGGSSVSANGDIAITANYAPSITTTSVASAIAAGSYAAAGGGAASVATIDGITAANVDASTLSAVGHKVEVSASSTATTDPSTAVASDAIGLGVAIGALTSDATIAGATEASATGASTITSNELDVLADSINISTPSVTGQTAGAITGDGVRSVSSISRTTDAFIGNGGSVSAGTGSVNIKATSHSSAHGATTVVDTSAIGIAAAVMESTISGHTIAGIGANATVNAGDLSVLAVSVNKVTADPVVAQFTLFGGDGGRAKADITKDAKTEANIGTDAQITLTGALDVSADAANTAKGSAKGGSGGFINGVVMLSEASVGAATTAEMDGHVLGSTGASVLATGANDAEATTTATAISGVGITGTGAVAEVSSDASVAALVGASSSIRTAGQLLIQATNTSQAVARSNAASGAVFGGVAGASLSATVADSTLAHMDGSVLDAASIELDATGKNTVVATALGISIGLFAGAGITPSAVVADSAVVEAALGSGANVRATGAAIEANATSTDSAAAGSTGVSVSGLAITIMNVDAESKGSTLAFVGDGAIINASSLRLDAQAVSSSSAGLTSVGIGLLADATQASITATDTHVVGAYVAAGAHVVTSGDVAILATSTDEGTGNALLGAGGLGSGIGFNAQATVSPQVTTSIDDRATVSAGGNVTLDAESHRAAAHASAVAVNIGGVAISLLNSHGDVKPTVHSNIGDSAVVTALGRVDVLADILAQSDSTDPRLTTDTFTPTTDVNTVDDTIYFPSHGLSTGDEVTYSPAPADGASANTPIGTDDSVMDPNPHPPLGTFEDTPQERDYRVIVVDSNRIKLGADFGTAEADTGDLLNPQSGVDPLRDRIRFEAPHLFKTGDAVKYSFLGTASLNAAALNTSSTYYVQVIDDFTIKLFASRDDAMKAPTRFDASANPGVVTSDGYIHLNGFTDGEAVTYVAPPPTAFSGINVNTDGTQETNDNIAAGKPVLVTVDNNSPYNNSIYLNKHIDANGNTVDGSGYATGDKVTYLTNSQAIGGLTSGSTYYTMPVGGNNVQLVPSYASLSSVTFTKVANGDDTIVRNDGANWSSDGFAAGQQIVITGTGSNNLTLTIKSVSGNTINIAGDPLTNESNHSATLHGSVISLTPDKSAGGQYFLVRPTLGALQDGVTYYVRDAATPGQFKLAATPGGPALDVSDIGRGGVHGFGLAGIKLTPAAPTALDVSANPNVVTADGYIHLNGFTDGEAVTYVAPPPTGFSSALVDTDGVGPVNNNSIYLNKHVDVNGNTVDGSGYSTGEKVTYRTNGTPIGGLTNGLTYYTLAVDANEVQLVPSYASLSSVTFTSVANGDDTIVRNDGGDWLADGFAEGQQIVITGTGSNNKTLTIKSVSGNTIRVDGDPLTNESTAATLHGSVISLNPDKSTAGQQVKHSLARPMLGELQDGATYYVRDAGTPGQFKLTDTPGGEALDVSDIGRSGVHGLRSPQELRIDLATQPAGQHRLLAPGGTSLRLISPPSGDGVSSVDTTSVGVSFFLTISIPESTLQITNDAQAHPKFSTTADAAAVAVQA